MQCTSCVGQIEKAASAVPGVTAVHVNLAAGDAKIVLDTDVAQPESVMSKVVQSINAAGFTAHAFDVGRPSDETSPAADGFSSPGNDEEVAYWGQRVRTCIGLLAGLLIVSMWTSIASAVVYVAGLINAGIGIRTSHLLALLADGIRPLQLLFGTLIYAFIGLPFVSRAVRQLRHFQVNMDTLIAIGVTAAFGHGVYQILFGNPPTLVFFDVGMIGGFVSLGRYLELRSRRKAARAVSRLLSLSPPVVTVLEDNHHVLKGLNEVRLGDMILVKPGDRIPLDATIINGASQTDESWLTGESRNVSKVAGDQVFAGSLNLEGGFDRARYRHQ